MWIEWGKGWVQLDLEGGGTATIRISDIEVIVVGAKDTTSGITTKAGDVWDVTDECAKVLSDCIEVTYHAKTVN